MSLSGLVLMPLRYRPITHLVLAGWLSLAAIVAARIWWRALQAGILDVRGPALERANGPLLLSLAMAAAAAVIFIVVATAFWAFRAFWLNLRQGRAGT